MCVIIHQPRGAHLDKKRAKRLWKTNPDGGGFAFINDAGSIETFRFMEFDDFWPMFEKTRSANPERDYLLHMRIATHGTVDLNNVHPFEVNENMVMAHNGIIHGVPDFHDGRSDTKVFIDEVLPRLPKGWLDDPYLTDMVEDWIGWSKLMFLTNDPDLSNSVYILNKHTGMQADGMWFSNSTGVNVWKSPATKTTTTYIGQRGGYPKVTKTTQTKRREFAGETPYTPPSRAYQEGSEDWANWLEQDRRDTKAWEEKISQESQTSLDIGGTDAKGEWCQKWLKQSNGSFVVCDRPTGHQGKCAAPKWADPKPLFSDDFLNEREEELVAKRYDLDMYASIYFMQGENRWECIGCDEMVNPMTGKCMCFSKICMLCAEFAGNCKCESGYSVQLVMYDDAPLEYQEWAMVAMMGLPKTGTSPALEAPF